MRLAFFRVALRLVAFLFVLRLATFFFALRFVAFFLVLRLATFFFALRLAFFLVFRFATFFFAFFFVLRLATFFFALRFVAFFFVLRFVLRLATFFFALRFVLRLATFFLALRFVAFFFVLRLATFFFATRLFGAAFLRVTFRFLATFRFEAFLRDFFLVAIHFLRVGYPELSIYNNYEKSRNCARSAGLKNHAFLRLYESCNRSKGSGFDRRADCDRQAGCQFDSSQQHTTTTPGVFVHPLS